MGKHPTRQVRTDPLNGVQLPYEATKNDESSGDLLGGRKTVQPRHSHVHQDDVWGQLPGQVDGLLPIAGFANHLDLRSSRKQDLRP